MLKIKLPALSNQPSAPSEHNHVKKLMAMLADGMPAARVSDVIISHDGWCGIHRGGFCNCDPTIKFKK